MKAQKKLKGTHNSSNRAIRITKIISNSGIASRRKAEELIKQGEITLNGKPVGVNWYGAKCFDVSGLMKAGENKLVIKYTTTLYNRMKTPAQPSGLIGPVRLIVRP